MLKVHSVETLGTHEGPGLRLVVFLQGCNLKCIYCHNPDTQKINSGKEYSDEDIIKLVEKQKAYFGENGGITFSGGEPLIQAGDIAPLFRKLKENRVNTAIDTAGTILSDEVIKTLEYTDLVLLDIKHMDQNMHEKITGVKSDVPLEFADYLKKKNIHFWIRVVLLPGFTDSEDNLRKIGKHFKEYKNLERVEILPYHTFGNKKYEELGIENKCRGINPPSPEDVDKAKIILEEYFSKVFVR